MVVEERTWYLYRGLGLLEVAGPIGRGQQCNFNQTPGKYPKEYIHLDSKHGESLKSRKQTLSTAQLSPLQLSC